MYSIKISKKRDRRDGIQKKGQDLDNKNGHFSVYKIHGFTLDSVSCFTNNFNQSTPTCLLPDQTQTIV